MDEDDCDIFADVTKFCNSKGLEEVLDKAQVSDLDVSDIPPNEMEIIPVSSKNSKSTKKTRSSPNKKSPTRNAEKQSKTGKRNFKNSASNSKKITQKSTEKNSTLPVTECIQSELLGRGKRGESRRLRNRRTTNRLSMESTINLVNNVNETSSTIQNPPACSNTQRGRARRNYMAQLAARPDVDVIDLVDSPPSPLPNLPTTVISVDSDEELTETKKLEVSFDTENPEISLKVKWGDGIEIFTYRKYQKFTDLMKTFANRENVPLAEIVLNLGDHIIQPSETPDSIDYKIYQFISGRIIRNVIRSDSALPRKKDANEIELKIQSNAWKKTISVYIKKQDTFRILYIKCSEELNVPVEKIRLSFDGASLAVDKTPNDLEMEGEEIIDCHL